ncbi:class I SAM-dependent methyltransferase [Arcticibacter tournemirensis]|uniref:Class I SAM-dependent methyltransferase n=1 Tax=Arcticibacter tournemirensis TaxID=699437 RepID=A0A4Q0MBR3_9SPHI|nr:class I SAM-dependent methyltransferase [Arcticibacter tournemirensis]RXF70614.1 class I SAM-dependent methyltransferase [Arcticibacter tournemirensis]
MNVKEAYDIWATQYDTNKNKTRDLEAISLRTTLRDLTFHNCLEIGCGTGKNTQWLLTKAEHITAIDLSEEMLAKAKSKIASENVKFVQADITQGWTFASTKYDMVTFSLVLEHIEDLNDIFRKLTYVVQQDGYVYIGELHPFKQYSGTKARFETEDGLNIVTCFNHHISDFTTAARNNGFRIMEVIEYFDDDDRTAIPRILTILLKKQEA